MNKTIAVLTLIFVTQFLSHTLIAQQQSQEISQEVIKKQKESKNTYTINAGRFILNEARFGFERQFSERESFRAILGIKYSLGAESFDSYKILLTYPNHFKVSKGVYLGLGYNYILNENKGVYFSTEWYYSFNYYDDKYYNHKSGKDEDTYTSLESMRLHKYGLKFLFGKKVNIVSNNKMDLDLDFFAGVGVMYRVSEITQNGIYSRGNTSDYSKIVQLNPPKVETNKNFYPTLHIGVLIGVSFK